MIPRTYMLYIYCFLTWATEKCYEVGKVGVNQFHFTDEETKVHIKWIVTLLFSVRPNTSTQVFNFKPCSSPTPPTKLYCKTNEWCWDSEKLETIFLFMVNRSHLKQTHIARVSFLGNMVIVTPQYHSLNVTMERCVLVPSVLTLMPPPFSVSSAHLCDNFTEFSCKTNYRCIPKWAVCNGVDDCRDNSDEQGCGRRGCRGVEGGTASPHVKHRLLDERWEYISHVIFSLFTSEKNGWFF